MLGGTLTGRGLKKFTVMTSIFTIASLSMISGRVFAETAIS
jgi:hypothetical protein